MPSGRSEGTLEWSVLARFGGFRASVLPPHGSSFQGDTVCVVDQAVQDGIGKGGVADDLMPGIEGKLTRHEGTPAAVSILEDLEEVTAFGIGQRCEAESSRTSRSVLESRSSFLGYDPSARPRARSSSRREKRQYRVVSPRRQAAWARAQPR